MVDCMIGSTKGQTKKKVRFSEEAMEILSPDKQNLKSNVAMAALEECGDNKKCRKTMPLNWQVMYKGIINYRNSIYMR